MDAELLYSPSRWCLRRSPQEAVGLHKEIVTEESESVLKEVPVERNISYGCKQSQKFDIFDFGCKAGAKTLIFIHGGYWQDFSKDISCYMVKPLIQCGVRVVVCGYTLAPSAKISEIVLEIKELVSFLENLSSCRKWGEMWFCGHSAGAHLAASILADETKCKLVSGFVLISGIYDLMPLIHTSVNDVLKMTARDCELFSPLRTLENNRANFYKRKVLVVTAENDSPAFQEQARNFNSVLMRLDVDTEFIVMIGEDHFSVMEKLKDCEYPLTKCLLKHLIN